MDHPPHDVTRLLQAWAAGDLEARERAVALVYRELRRRAAAHLRRERPGHTLQPTALVHEAYIRLVDQRHAAWQNRAHFLAVASQMMRRILVDRARARRAVKRSGQWTQVTLDHATGLPTMPKGVDLLDLDAALAELAAFDARKSRIAELRFFGGLSLEEMSHVLDVSSRTVERDWQLARAWLFKTLSGQARGVGDDA
jgi:RNA polymerase sigma-70 factor, ECF subfamily